MRTRFAAAAALCLAGALPLAADPLDDARSAFLAAWEAAPLSVRQSLFVTTPAAGYGIYEPRGSNVFSGGEPLYIYLQPMGYGWGDLGGSFEFGVTIGLVIRGEGGEALFENQGFMELKTQSMERPTEFFGNVTLNLTGFPQGAFALDLLLTDINGGEQTTVTMPFEVR